MMFKIVVQGRPDLESHRRDAFQLLLEPVFYYYRITTNNEKYINRLQTIRISRIHL